MADEQDAKLSQRYRELEALEPPPAVDQKILAAAREAAQPPHAPLVAPAGRHRWYYSLAAAAVLVFAVALTLHLERERPGPEGVSAPTVRGEIKQAPKAEAPPPAQPKPAPVFTPDPQASAPREAGVPPRAAETRAPAPASRVDERRAQEAQRMRAEQAASGARAQADAEARARNETAAAAKQQTSAARLAASPAAAAPDPPERWLERIAELRTRGRHVDADRELAAFRRAYPDYQLSDLMRERVEGTPAPAAQ